VQLDDAFRDPRCDLWNERAMIGSCGHNDDFAANSPPSVCTTKPVPLRRTVATQTPV
jgi:hypothetical protein